MPVDVFISHHTKSSFPIAEAICNSLESNGVRCWYAPRNTTGAYAGSIAHAIRECQVFIIVLNRDASFSQDVLNEINLAVQRVRRGENLAILPFQISADEISADAEYYLGRLHWIDAITPPMEDRIQELTNRILSMTGCENSRNIQIQKRSSLRSSSVLPNVNFIGRDREIVEIDAVLTSDHIVFLYGLGGSGKTELAKNYFHKYKGKYDTIIFARYESSLQDLLINDQIFQFERFGRMTHNGIQPETDASYAKRKLDMIKKTATSDTLIILDNFDATTDPMLEEFLSGPYKLIITTRTDFSDLGLPMIHIDSIEPLEQQRLFKQYYKRPLSANDEKIVSEIIGMVNGHTLTVELIAKLMHSKRIKPTNMYESLKKSGVSPELKGSVRHGFMAAESIYDHIRTLFQVGELSDKETNVLMNLSLLPISGVPVDGFIEWCKIDSYETIDSLIKRSWILYDISKDAIALHPVISDIVRSECSVSLETCKVMVSSLTDRFSSCWNMRVDERIECGEIAKSLYFKNPFTDISNFNTYQIFFKLFKTLAYHDLCDRLADDMKHVLGDLPSIELGWYHYEIGDISIVRMQYQKAVQHLEKSISIFEEINPDSYELAYVTKHLAHTYHAIYEHQETACHWLEKARILLHRSGNIFSKCVEEYSPQMGSQLYAMGLNYYYRGDYAKALECEQHSFDIFMHLNGEVNSDTNAPMRVLAKIYAKLGRLDDAINMQNRVIAARKELWGTSHFNYFVQYETLADIYFDSERIDEGVRALQRVMELIGTETEQYYIYISKIRKKIEQYNTRL